MKQLKYFRTLLFIRPTIVYYSVAFAMIIDFIISLIINEGLFLSVFNENTLPYIKSILSVLYFLSVSLLLFFLLFDTYDIRELLLLDDDDIDLSKNDSLSFAMDLIYDGDFRSGFLHLGKSRDQILGGKNTVNYMLIVTLMFAWQFSFQYFKPIWSFAFYFFVVVFVTLALIVIVVEFKKIHKKEGLIIITHFLLGYFILSWGKNVYVRSYGDETIGSYFEKSEYRTMYYVLLKNGEREIKLPAQIHVENTIETEESSDGVLSTETTISQKNRYIVLEKVLFDDGTILSFRDCELNWGRSSYCSDLIGRGWEVELLNEKYIN